MSFNASSIQPFEYVPGVENLGPRWTSWMDRLEQYFTASGYDNDAKMNAALLFLAGESVNKLYGTLKSEAIPASANISNTKVYDQTKYRLNQFFQPKRNKIIERFNFTQAKQEANETIYQFISRLRVLSEHCEFGNNADEWIITQVVQSCNSDVLRREYLKKTDLTYADLLNIGRNHDNVEDQARLVEGKIEIKQEPVYSVRENTNPNRHSAGKNTSKSNTKSSQNNTNRTSKEKNCFKCGGEYPHPDGKECPAIGKVCVPKVVTTWF